MALNVTIFDVTVRDDNKLDVAVAVSVTGRTRNQRFSGEVNVTGGNTVDRVPISGSVGRGAGSESNVTLDPGLSTSQLPETVLVTAVTDTGDQDQQFVELSFDGGGGNGGGVDDSGSVGSGGNGGNGGNGGSDGIPGDLSAGDIALGLGVVAAGYALSQL